MSARVVVVAVLALGALALGALALGGCPAHRPCRDDAQCEPGQSCVLPSSGGVGACSGPVGEAEGEGQGGEGEGQAGEGEGEGQGGPVLVDTVDVGIGYQCVLDHDARVQCWGTNFSEQLGRETVGTNDPVPAAVPHLHGVVKLAVAQRHACAIGLLDAGPLTVVCWGDGTEGSLGQVGALPPFALVEPNVGVSSLRGALDVDADGDNNGGVSCLADDGGKVKCWGPRMPGYDPANGRVVEVPALAGATQVFVSRSALCGKIGGDIVCTGFDAGAIAHLSCPDGQRCNQLSTATAFSFTFDNGCLAQAGSALCAGDNTYGVVDPFNRAAGDLPFASVIDAVDVSVGVEHACAIELDGTAVCWGRSLELSTGRDVGDSQLVDCNDGAGSSCQGTLAVAGVAAPLRFSDIETRNTQTCARESDGHGVVCWGFNAAPAETTFVHQP